MNNNQSIILSSLVIILMIWSYPLINRLLDIKTKQLDMNRYELFLNPNVGRFQYLLDKKTGKIWQATTYTDIKGQPTVWAHMIRIDNDDQLVEFARLKEGL